MKRKAKRKLIVKKISRREIKEIALHARQVRQELQDKIDRESRLSNYPNVLLNRRWRRRNECF